MALSLIVVQGIWRVLADGRVQAFVRISPVFFLEEGTNGLNTQ